MLPSKLVIIKQRIGPEARFPSTWAHKIICATIKTNKRSYGRSWGVVKSIIELAR